MSKDTIEETRELTIDELESVSGGECGCGGSHCSCPNGGGPVVPSGQRGPT